MYLVCSFMRSDRMIEQMNEWANEHQQSKYAEGETESVLEWWRETNNEKQKQSTTKNWMTIMIMMMFSGRKLWSSIIRERRCISSKKQKSIAHPNKNEKKKKTLIENGRLVGNIADIIIIVRIWVCFFIAA